MVTTIILRENVFKPLLVAVAAILFGATQTDCKPPGSDELEEVYRAELKHCVEISSTKKQSCECRKLVDTKWGLCAPEIWPRIGRCDFRCEDLK